MLTVPSPGRNPRVLLLGIDCRFTNLVLQALLESGVAIAAIGLPGIPGSPVPLKPPETPKLLPLADTGPAGPNLQNVARKAAISVYRFGSLTSAEATSTIRSIDADILLSVCYSRLIPQRTVRLFPQRALNVHPSPLPQLRGPDPLFWTFREGRDRTSLTIHELSSTMDAGAIVAQREVRLADGITESALEDELALLAVEMLADILASIQRGNPLQRRPQDDTQATYAPFPSDDDFQLSASMSARTAFNFVRGVEERGVPVTVEFQGRLWQVIEAIEYHQFDSSQEGSISLPFSDGYLLARIAPHSH